MELWEYNILIRVKKNWTVLGVFFLILSVSFAYAYNTTPAMSTTSTTVTKTLFHWSGGIGGAGVVVHQNPIWNVGEIVELPIYPLSITPLAELTLNFSIQGKDVDIKFEREIRAVYYISYDEERVVEEVYLATTNVSRGSSFRDDLLLNVSDIYARLDVAKNILRLPREKFGVEIVGRVRYEGTVDGKPVSGIQKFKSTLSFPYEGFYVISNDHKNGTQTFTETISKTKEVNNEKRALLLGLSVLSAVLFVAVLIVGRKFDPSSYDMEDLLLKKEKKKLAKWISSGKLPKNLPAKRIELASLTDLVEAAIDMNKRVIHDAEQGIYFFLDEGVLYYFREMTPKD